MVRRLKVSLLWSCALLLFWLGSVQAAVITPKAGTLADFKLHNLDATKLDSATLVTLKAGKSDTWTEMLTNGSMIPWTDFHVEILNATTPVDALPAQFDSVRASGFSITSPASFKTKGGGSIFGPPAVADLGPSVTLGTVDPGKSITLSVKVVNNSVFLPAEYYLGVQATSRAVPEPSSLALIGTGIGAILLLRRQRAQRMPLES